MRAMREVNINWKMLTNLRPDNKADEIFFAQWETDKLNIFLGKGSIEKIDFFKEKVLNYGWVEKGKELGWKQWPIRQFTKRQKERARHGDRAYVVE